MARNRTLKIHHRQRGARQRRKAAHLVCVAADRSDALDPEVERRRREPGSLEEGHDEAAQAAVDVQTDAVLRCELPENDDVVLASVWEIYRRSYELKERGVFADRLCRK